MPNRLTPLDFQTAAIELNLGTFTTRWEQLLRLLFGDVASVSSLPAVVNRFAFAAQPLLGVDDAGYIAFETTYGHLLRWTGAVWEFAPGDIGNGFFRDFAIAPQETGWKLCDGTPTDYLTLGAALTVTAITPPNLNGTPTYRKSGAYVGAIVAASAPGLSGNTANAGGHGHNVPRDTVNFQDVPGPGLGVQVALSIHTHTADAVADHAHGVGTLAADATGEPAHLAALPYFRR